MSSEFSTEMSVADEVEQDLLQILQARIDDEFSFKSREREEAGKYRDMNQWALKAAPVMARLAAFATPSDTDPIHFAQELDVPSTHQLVENEIKRFMDHEDLTQVRPLAEIEAEREKSISNSSLSSLQLRAYADQNLDTFKAIRFSLPPINGVACKDPGHELAESAVVSVQVYKTINNRETKLLEIDCPAACSLEALFRTVTNLMPETKMFDGPQYADSGLFVIGERMYTTGSENYAEPYTTWLKQVGKDAVVSERAAMTLGNLPNLPALVVESKSAFLVYCGSEMLRMYFSNVSLKKNSTEPTVTYKRKIPRFQRCILCTTRVADLIVVNDEYLAKNPAHCCNGCYRRIRSDADGNFDPPGENVVLSSFSLI